MRCTRMNRCDSQCVVLYTGDGKYIKFMIHNDDLELINELVKRGNVRDQIVDLYCNETVDDVKRLSSGLFGVDRTDLYKRNFSFDFKKFELNDTEYPMVLEEGNVDSKEGLKALLIHFFKQYENHEKADRIYYYAYENGKQIFSGRLDPPNSFKCLLESIEAA